MTASLLEREDLTPTLAIFRVRPETPPREGEPWFLAGQHVRVSVEDASGARLDRPLSIASPPEERRFLEFCVRRASRGSDPFVDRLWALRPGDAIGLGTRFSGSLTIRDTVGEADDRLLVFVAAGTGIAPCASLAASAARREDPKTLGRIAVLHGVSRPEDLAYRFFFERTLPRRRYLPTVSRESRDWAGARGRVEDLFVDDRLDATERSLGLPDGWLVPDRAAILVCGFPETARAVAERLSERGFATTGDPRRRIHVEA